MILAQITDTHLLDSPSSRLRGCQTWHTLKAVLDQIATETVHGILLTGDLADSGSRAAYQHLYDLLEPLQLPCYWIPGNHDQLAPLADTLVGPPFSAQKVLQGGGWHVILLNSVLTSAQWGEGYLTQQDLSQLETILESSDKPTMLVLHHHVLPTGIAWLDQIRVQNSAQLLQLLDGYPQVQIVLTGHVHLASHQTRHDTHFYTTPSTCLQVIPSEVTPAQDLQLPGYRLITLDPDGSHTTVVRRVPWEI